jgi:ABC-type xylose transport system permease subunit
MLMKRWKAKTPNFWKKVQKIGLAVGAIGGAILTAPISLPAAVITTAGYLVTAGAVTAAVSQLTVENPKDLEDGPKEEN